MLLNTRAMPPPDHCTYRHAQGLQRPQFQCFFLLNNTRVVLVMLETRLPREEDEGWLEKGVCRGNNSSHEGFLELCFRVSRDPVPSKIEVLI